MRSSRQKSSLRVVLSGVVVAAGRSVGCWRFSRSSLLGIGAAHLNVAVGCVRCVLLDRSETDRVHTAKNRPVLGLLYQLNFRGVRSSEFFRADTTVCAVQRVPWSARELVSGVSVGGGLVGCVDVENVRGRLSSSAARVCFTCAIHGALRCICAEGESIVRIVLVFGGSRCVNCESICESYRESVA